LRQLARAAEEKKSVQRAKDREKWLSSFEDNFYEFERDLSKCSLPGGGSVLLPAGSGESLEDYAAFIERLADDSSIPKGSENVIRELWIQRRPLLAKHLRTLRTLDHWTDDGSPFDEGDSAQWSFDVHHMITALQKVAEEGWLLQHPLNTAEAENLLPLILMISANDDEDRYIDPTILTLFGRGMGAQRAALDVLCSMIHQPTHGRATMVDVLRDIMGTNNQISPSGPPEDHTWIEAEDVQRAGEALKAVLSSDDRTRRYTIQGAVEAVGEMFLGLPHFARELWATGVGAAAMKCYAENRLEGYDGDWRDGGCFLYAASQAIWASSLPQSRRPYTLSPEGICKYEWGFGEKGMYECMKEAESWAFFDTQDRKFYNSINRCNCLGCCDIDDGCYKSDLRCQFFEYYQSMERKVEITMQLATKVIDKAKAAAFSDSANAKEVAALTAKALVAARKAMRTHLNSNIHGKERIEEVEATQRGLLVDALTLECTHGSSSSSSAKARPLLEELLVYLEKRLPGDLVGRGPGIELDGDGAEAMLQAAKVHARLGELAEAKALAECVVAAKRKGKGGASEKEQGGGAEEPDPNSPTVGIWQEQAAELLAELSREEEESPDVGAAVEGLTLQRPICKGDVEAAPGLREVVKRWSWRSAGADQFEKYAEHHHIEIIDRLHVCVFKLRADLLVWDYENEEVFHWLKHVPHMLRKWKGVETQVGTALFLYSRGKRGTGENRPRVVILDELAKGGTTSMMSVDRYGDGNDTHYDPEFPLLGYEKGWRLTGLAKTVLPHIESAWPMLDCDKGIDDRDEIASFDIASWYERVFCSWLGSTDYMAATQNGSSWALAVANPRNNDTSFPSGTSIGVVVFDGGDEGEAEGEGTDETGAASLREGGSRADLSRLGVLGFPFLLPNVASDFEDLFDYEDEPDGGMKKLSSKYARLRTTRARVVYLRHQIGHHYRSDDAEDCALAFSQGGSSSGGTSTLPPILLSCGCDVRKRCVAKVWHYASGECLFQLDDFQAPPSNLVFAEGLLFAASKMGKSSTYRGKAQQNRTLLDDKIFVYDCGWSTSSSKSSYRPPLIGDIPNPLLPDGFDLATHRALSVEDKREVLEKVTILEGRGHSGVKGFHVASLTVVPKHRILLVMYRDYSLFLLRYAAPPAADAGSSAASPREPLLTYLRRVQLAQPKLKPGFSETFNYPRVSFAVERSGDAMFAATYPYLLRIPFPPLKVSASSSSAAAASEERASSGGSSPLSSPQASPLVSASSSAEIMNCDFCGMYKGIAASQSCGGCKAVRYCDSACVKAGWKTHSSVCKGNRKAMKKKEAAAVEPLPDVMLD